MNKFDLEHASVSLDMTLYTNIMNLDLDHKIKGQGPNVNAPVHMKKP